MREDLSKLVKLLHTMKVRATYGAVGEALGLPARSIGGMLGSRRPEVSWIVSAEDGMPTGYGPSELHPDLESRREIIDTGLRLLQVYVGWGPKLRDL